MGIEGFNEQRKKRCLFRKSLTLSKDVDSTCLSSVSSDGESEESKPLRWLQGPGQVAAPQEVAGQTHTPL